MVSVADAPSLGEAFRVARESRGLSLHEVAEITRVRREYLNALEESAWSKLPSRPFAVGYVKAYARALGLDEETAAERFKKESPDTAAPFRPPVGVEHEEKPRRLPALAVAGLVAFAAVVSWNVAQRAMLSRAPSPSAVVSTPSTWSLGQVPGGVIKVGAPAPAPADQSLPPPYVTPGLEPQLIAASDAIAAAAAATGGEADQGPVAAAFNPRGAIYGADPRASNVILQAKKAANLVVRTNDGVVYFARQLAAGESWRAPQNLPAGALVDVSDPTAFDLYFYGEWGGRLEGLITPLSSINRRAAAHGAQIEATRRAEAEAEAAQAGALRQAATQAPAPRPAATTAPAAPAAQAPAQAAPAPVAQAAAPAAG